jgi:hypothetical protein
VDAHGHRNDKMGKRRRRFIGVNWPRNEREPKSAWRNDTLMADGQPGDVYEARAGLRTQVGGGWTGWGELNVSRG